jgi:MarR family transcriptional regulator, lower aerobic nicotinate degradation pathway regulator
MAPSTSKAPRAVRASPPAEGSEGCGLLLMRLARAANRSLACSLEALGLRSQQFGILHRLARHGPASQSELAAGLRVHASNLVRLLDELERIGLVRRERDPLDRRRQVVAITPAGNRLLARAAEAAEQTERELLAPLDPTERRQLEGLLGRLAAHSCALPGSSRCGPGRE